MKRLLSLGLLPALCLFLLPLAAAPVHAANPANPFVVTPLETRVFGQNTWLRGGPAALRVIVSDHKTGAPGFRPGRCFAARAENGGADAVFRANDRAWHGRRGVYGSANSSRAHTR